ncbi:bifunctional glycosyltransferase/CDP-glycerol:glycerophosphate glycerophosphotransferase [Streptomyces liangshanensis]|uniref:Glycosyltransferase n=1 Tax=Streptomyces liangshanensis TaxID=2717324 RepID=A0A6G9H234_9ACTN|nr:CDP-glycerol glycerophosphotransferase family protein [Streptomyces liangshanensis]QIQ04565.1 glycosyltransferase [Streptomyces liangshanensis]
MPRFSVIVSAYKVQAYLQDCLASVLTQTCDDLELIVVDDGSPDACGEIAGESAARDRRVVPVRLTAHAGTGPARNAGLARATGDYVVFLDGRDTLVPGALQALSDRLKETDGPDVLVHDHAVAHPSDGTVRTPCAATLTGRSTPDALALLLTATDKAYRGEFVESAGLTFPPGPFSDVAWTCQALMTAASIVTLDQVCAVRRPLPLPAAPSAYLDVFDQYDRVFAFLDGRPDADRWRPVVRGRMLDHLALLAPTARPRAAFFRRARAHLRRHRAPGATGGHLPLRLGAHRTYAVLRAALALRARARRTSTAARRAGRALALRLHYALQRRLPLRADRAAFATYGPGGDPAAIERKLRALAPAVRTSWLTDPDSFAYWTALARSAYLTSNTHFDPRLVKRPGQTLLQTHRGTPLASVGLDLADRPAVAADLPRMLADAARWDYTLAANRHATLTHEKAYPSPATTLELGHPRHDTLHAPADVPGLRAALGIPEGFTTVLYAPAHRDHHRVQTPSLDLERLARALGPRYVVLSRVAPAAPHPRIMDVSEHPSEEILCLVADALVTDHAPLMFDYAHLDRPIVLHLADHGVLEAVRGTYVDLRAFPPGAVARTEDELIDIFTTDHWRGSRSTQLRTAFRARFCPYADAGAAERVVRRVFLT